MINLTDTLLIWIGFFVFIRWYENSLYVIGLKERYGRYKHKLIKYIKKTV